MLVGGWVLARSGQREQDIVLTTECQTASGATNKSDISTECQSVCEGRSGEIPHLIAATIGTLAAMAHEMSPRDPCGPWSKWHVGWRYV